MPSSTIALDNLANESQTYTLVGSSDRGATFKVATRALSQPKQLVFDYSKVGQPGSLGNDKLTVTMSNTVENSAGVSPAYLTGQAVVTVSIPRGPGWTVTNSNDLLAELASLLSDARLQSIVEAIVP